MPINFIIKLDLLSEQDCLRCLVFFREIVIFLRGPAAFAVKRLFHLAWADDLTSGFQ